MYIENGNSSTGFVVPETGLLRGSPETVLALEQAESHLFDLDDTVALYDPEYTRSALSQAFVDHVEGVDDTIVAKVAAQLAVGRNTGAPPDAVLGEFMDKASMRSFWSRFTTLFSDQLKPGDVRFDPAAVQFIDFVMRHALGVGFISNSPEKAGIRLLDRFEGETGIRLHPLTAFLGDTTVRKPKTGALDVFRETVDPDVCPGRAAYIGNAVSDLVFADRIGSVGVVIDHEGHFSEGVVLGDAQRELVDRSIVSRGFADLQRHIMRARPGLKVCGRLQRCRGGQAGQYDGY